MKKAFVFDFDHTIAITQARILVYDAFSKKPVKRLTAKEFSSYQLKLEYIEYFDFSEFRDASFIDAAEATFLLGLAKEVYDESHSVYILTAREDNVSEAIIAWLKTHGITPKMVYCIGGEKQTIAENKKEILLSIMAKYEKCYYYDDCPKNIEAAPNGGNLRKYQVCC